MSRIVSGKFRVAGDPTGTAKSGQLSVLHLDSVQNGTCKTRYGIARLRSIICSESEEEFVRKQHISIRREPHFAGKGADLNVRDNLQVIGTQYVEHLRFRLIRIEAIRTSHNHQLPTVSDSNRHRPGSNKYHAHRCMIGSIRSLSVSKAGKALLPRAVT